MKSIACKYIDTCYPDYLTDHHNRDNELLISANVSAFKSSIYQDFWNSAIRQDTIPQNISDSEIESAIKCMVNDLDLSILEKDSNFYQQEIYIYAYLSW